MNIKKEQKLTIIGSNDMGATYRQEAKIVEERDGRFLMTLRDNRSKRLGRNKYWFNPKEGNVVFEGWDLPIDANTNEQYGAGGCISFVLCGGGINVIYRSDPQNVQAVREYIEKNNINEAFVEQKYLELHFQGRTLARLYPELQTK